MDIYALAWRLFSSKIASRRRKLISKDELMRWQLWALEEAIGECGAANRLIPPEARAIRRHAGIEDEHGG